MNPKTKVVVASLLSGLITILWGLGLIFADIRLFAIAMAILVISLVFAVKYFDEIKEYFKSRKGEIVEDERKEYIDYKSSMAAFGAVLAINIYLGIVFLTLRNIYPEYVILFYPFIGIAILGIIAQTISRSYYKRKYGA